MKKTNILPGAAVLTVVALTACSNDLPNSGPEVSGKDEVRYVSISISNPPSTRAASFEDGTDKENIVGHAFFIFYDKYGAVVGDNTIEGLTFDNNPEGNDLSVGKIATTTVRLTIPKGSNAPAYVVAFLNPVDYDEISAKPKMEDLRNLTRDDYLCTHKNFAMNNSAYYGANTITGESNVKILGAPVKEDQLHTTKEAADAATGASAIDIYVERYAVKVKLSLREDKIEDQTIGEGENKYILKFVPDAWTINADAPTMYASKRFENSNSTDHLIPTYAQVQEMLGTWTTWNDAPNHRSYWACSPGYYATKFPAVSDDIIEDAGEGKTGAGIQVGDYALRYYSYNQIADQSETNTSDGKGITVFNNGGDNFKYVLENTMGSDAFKCDNPKAAAPSAVIVGHYEVWKDGKEIEESPGFCLYADNLYFLPNTIPALKDVTTIKDILMDRNGILATDQNGTLMTSSAAQAIKNCLEVVHPSAAVRGTQKVPHRYVTLQLKQGLTQQQLQGLYYKPAGSDTWLSVAPTGEQTLEEVITGINKQLWAQLGNARIYNQNLGYFSIPIQHLGITENVEADETKAPIAKDGSINWQNVRVGDFGLVRNHVYTLEVEAITGMASGIDGPDNPLVPSMEDEDYWVRYKINILNWRVVPAQTGIVLK